ncbi:hypothetical protein [Roseateles violae]|uniref:Uncharacterized protein n=1 Tax=Roseateles violae TaxID=3058042 RepID=A0ABT8DP30_9BURK|nr:hypothetical protein [Pelomonas sp. PFR6]MDN3920109.1 hypothetical protein [Pelomonas sp. PFR6]
MRDAAMAIGEALSNNERLRRLVLDSGLPWPVALTIFNRGLGSAAISVSHWRGLLDEPGSERFRALDDRLLQHAQQQFAKIGVRI